MDPVHACWVVPYPVKGSGGLRTVFSHISNLADNGISCDVYVAPPGTLSSEKVKSLVENYYCKCNANFYVEFDFVREYDIAFSTTWWTTPVVFNQINATHKAYFIQDYEPWFNPVSDGYIMAENTYRLGLIPITIGRWLSHKMKQDFGIKAYHYDLSADLSIYRTLGDKIRREKAICFVYQPEKPRRCPIIGKDALAIVKTQRPDIKIYTYGTAEEPDFPFQHTHLGLLDVKACNDLYNRCMVGLCLSSSNPSRIPFEMMAAGLPVVEFWGENTIFDLPDNAVLLARRNPASLALAILQIINDPIRQEQMSQHGREFMRNRDVKVEHKQFLTAVKRVLAGDTPDGEKVQPLYSRNPVSEIPITGEILELQKPRDSIMRRIKRRLTRAWRVLRTGSYLDAE